jgi:hypothetical protein
LAFSCIPKHTIVYLSVSGYAAKILIISDRRQDMFKKFMDNKKLGGVPGMIGKNGKEVCQES